MKSQAATQEKITTATTEPSDKETLKQLEVALNKENTKENLKNIKTLCGRLSAEGVSSSSKLIDQEVVALVHKLVKKANFSEQEDLFEKIKALISVGFKITPIQPYGNHPSTQSQGVVNTAAQLLYAEFRREHASEPEDSPIFATMMYFKDTLAKCESDFEKSSKGSPKKNKP